MVRLDVHLHVVGQAVSAEEVDACGAVEIVLVLRRLLGFRLEVELPGEADFAGVIDGHVHELGEVVQLALHVGVPEVLVALAPAPECVARAAKLLGHFQSLLYLGGGKGEGVGIRTGGRAVDVARIAEQVGCAPKHLNARPLHLFLDDLDHGVEVFVRLGQRRAFGRDVAVVEAEERGGQLLHELEGHADPPLGHVDVIDAALPRAEHRARAERVAAGSAEGMPIGDAEAEVILHRLAGHDFRLVVVAEGERIFGLRAFVTDFGDFGKCVHKRSFVSRIRML